MTVLCSTNKETVRMKNAENPFTRSINPTKHFFNRLNGLRNSNKKPKIT